VEAGKRQKEEFLQMNVFRKLRPTPSMVIACAALLVALAGTSVAAVSIVIPRNSVGPLQLKANSVNSSKVQNFTLRRVDFVPGAIPVARRGATGPAGPAGPAGAAGPAGPAGAAGTAAPGYTAETLAQTGTSDSATTSTSYTNLNGGSLTVNVPSGETDKLVVFFSGESTCYGGNSLQKCLLKITVDGSEIAPAGGADAFFDNNDLGVGSPNHNTDDSFKSKSSSDSAQHAIVRVSGNLSGGSHTVQVQYSVTNASTAFNLDDWALVVQRIKVS
jgi:hypothetical protein